MDNEELPICSKCEVAENLDTGDILDCSNISCKNKVCCICGIFCSAFSCIKIWCSLECTEKCKICYNSIIGCDRCINTIGDRVIMKICDTCYYPCTDCSKGSGKIKIVKGSMFKMTCYECDLDICVLKPAKD